MSRAHDAIVVGLGAHGSAAALALARRGLRVLGIDGGERAHGAGSSGGRSRIIRRAYFEDLAYLPLLEAAWAGWRALEDEAGERLIEETGGLYAGPAGSGILDGSVRSAVEQGLPHEVLDADEIHRRWPIFRVDGMTGLHDPRAGMIRPERAIEVQLAQAERRGAELRFGQRALEWRPAAGGGIELETDAGVERADRLVLVAGAWLGRLVPDLRLPLTVERVPVVWFEPLVPVAEVAVGRLPVWIVDTAFDGAFYGFPYDPAVGLKVARHHSGEATEPDATDRSTRAADVERIRAFLRRHMPAADGQLRDSIICLYTNTPDHHFVLDTHPAVPGVSFASACSGHGFKFTPVIGEILADLALSGTTDHSIDFLRSDRFGPAA